MRISALRIVAVATTCLVATGCTGGSPASSGEGSSGALKYLVEQQEDPEAAKALEDRLADFTEETGVDVELSTLPLDTMRTVLQTQLRSGEGPDVFNWGSGPGFGGALAEAGLVQDLTAAYEENDWQVYDFAKERVTVDGKVYGVPGEMETLGLYYNTQIFTDLGLAPPQTLDDLRAAAEEIKAAGIVPLAVGDQEGWEGGHLLSMTLSNSVGSDGVEALIAGEASWDSPEVVSALALWKDLNDAGLLSESPTSVDYDTSTAQFFSGEAAMIPTGSWLINEIGANADFEAGYIPFPAQDGPGIFTGGLGSGPYVSASTQKQEAALQLVDFLASPEHGRWTVENLQTIPPQPIDTAGLDIDPLLAQVLQDVSTLSTGGDFGQNIDVLTSDAFNEAMYDSVQGVLTGQSTPEEAAAALQAAAQG
jgi:raffinose/stachyose/melibiose transport system substrate-binding protein